MTLLDSSFLYAYYRNHDVHHGMAVEQAFQYQNESAHIPLEIFEELITLIGRKQGSDEAVKIGKLLLSEKSAVHILSMIPSQFLKTWQLFQTLSPYSLSYVDCLLITLAREYQCSILTFDKAILEYMKKDG